MKKIALLLISFFILTACNSNQTQDSDIITTSEFTVNGKKDGFVMYEMSEMAALMEQMFVENQRLKERIIANDTLGKMPEYFTGILNKKLTDPSDFDQFYREHAAMFLKQQQNIYNNPEKAKEMFNASIDACIKCHEVKCGGPIQRIKKLYIN